MTIRVLYHIARADFFERTRRYSFLIMLIVTAYVAWAFVPPNDASWTTLTIHGMRGIYNSAWVGAQVAMLTSVFLSLTGFYLIKNSVDRDYQTRVGQILAASPLTKLKYTIGKLCSNAAVLWAIALVMIVVAGVMQQVRAEDRALDLAGLILPFLIALGPTIFLIAGITVLFECVSWLRGGFGNVVYFFLMIAGLSSQFLENSDVFGMAPYLASMRAAALAAYPGSIGPEVEMNMGFQIRSVGDALHLSTFPWAGLDLTGGMILGRLGLCLVAVAMAAGAALIFDRFDSLRATGPTSKKPSRLDRVGAWVEEKLSPQLAPTTAGVATRLTPLSSAGVHPRLLKTMMAELRVMAKGQHAVWYLGVLGLIIAGLVAPLAGGLTIVMPIAWIWPMLIWSQMGCREVRQGTNQYLFSAASPVMRQLPATWLAGVAIAMIAGGGVGIRLLANGNTAGLATWVVGAMFVPAMALACGTLTNGSRLFEAVYLFLWYAGPLNRVPAMDYMGASGEMHTGSITVVYAVMTAVLLLVAVLGRRRQLYV